MASTTVKTSRTIDAPRSAVWAVLADFPNISQWTSQVKTSYATGDATTGVGAARHCDLAPAGQLEEEILEFDPESRMVIAINSTKVVPIKSSVTTFTLDEVGPTSTRVTMQSEPELKGGALGGLVSKRLEKRLTSGLDDLLGDLAAEAEKQPA